MRWARRLGPTRKSFVQPPFWHPDHPLSQIWGGTTGSSREIIENDFEGYVQGAYKANGAVFACVSARMMVFSSGVCMKVRKRYDETNDGAPGPLMADERLAILEHPWPGGTLGDVFAKMEQDVSLAGNSYWTVRDDRLVRLRPDWVEIFIGVKNQENASVNHIDAEVLGYFYKPKGTGYEQDLAEEVFLLAEQVAHFAPNPDPIAKHRGMSWITAAAKDIESDNLATRHKKAFYENAAVPNIAVKFDRETSEDAFDEFVESYNANHKGAWNAYKTLFLMGGADVTPLTMDFHQLEFNQTVGKGESRIAATAGVPSSWVGFSEGMQGSALNAGNFSAARRRFADGTIRPLWEKASASLAVLVDLDPTEQLWVDASGSAFLREDMKDQAQIFQTLIIGVEAGMRGGFEPDAVIKAAMAAGGHDLRYLLGAHTGLTSVQMMNTDIEGQRGQEEAQTREIESRAIAALITSGCTIDSIAAFMESGDASKLKKDPKALINQQAEHTGDSPQGSGPNDEERRQRSRALASNQSNKPTGGGSSAQGSS